MVLTGEILRARTNRLWTFALRPMIPFRSRIVGIHKKGHKVYSRSHLVKDYVICLDYTLHSFRAKVSSQDMV